VAVATQPLAHDERPAGEREKKKYQPGVRKPDGTEEKKATEVPFGKRIRSGQKNPFQSGSLEQVWVGDRFTSKKVAIVQLREC